MMPKAHMTTDRDTLAATIRQALLIAYDDEALAALDALLAEHAALVKVIDAVNLWPLSTEPIPSEDLRRAQALAKERGWDKIPGGTPDPSREALARVAALEAERDAEKREVGEQMAAKLEAQMALKSITEAIDLRFDQIGNGWSEGVLAILARIEEIVDQAARDHGQVERAEAENHKLREAATDFCANETLQVYGRRWYELTHLLLPYGNEGLDADGIRERLAALAAAGAAAAEEET